MDVFREDVTALLPHLRAFARSLTGGDRQSSPACLIVTDSRSTEWVPDTS